jgi:hypothetical protein
LIGICGEEAYARVSPIRDALYGLAFRTGNGHDKWDGLLLIDTLADVVEHALIAVDALPGETGDDGDEAEDENADEAHEAHEAHDSGDDAGAAFYESL